MVVVAVHSLSLAQFSARLISASLLLLFTAGTIMCAFPLADFI